MQASRNTRILARNLATRSTPAVGAIMARAAATPRRKALMGCTAGQVERIAAAILAAREVVAR